MEENKRKRRSKGSGSFASEQKRLKSSGKSYKTYKNEVIPGKNAPSQQVCYFNIVLIFKFITLCIFADNMQVQVKLQRCYV